MKIIEAAKSGNSDLISELIASGEDVLEEDEDGRTALHFAAINGDTDLVKKLVSNWGIPIDAKDKEGCTAFLESCSEEHWDTAEELLNLGANPNCYACGTAPILIAAAYLQTPLIEKMLSIKDEHGNQKLDLTVSTSENKINALHAATSATTNYAGKNLNLAKILYDHGTPNCPDLLGHTPIDNLQSHDWYFAQEFSAYISSSHTHSD